LIEAAKRGVMLAGGLPKRGDVAGATNYRNVSLDPALHTEDGVDVDFSRPPQTWNYRMSRNRPGDPMQRIVP